MTRLRVSSLLYVIQDGFLMPFGDFQIGGKKIFKVKSYFDWIMM